MTWKVRAKADGETREFSVEDEAVARAGAAQMVAGGGWTDVRVIGPDRRKVDISADVDRRRSHLGLRHPQGGDSV